MAEEKSISERQEELKLNLAERMMDLLPQIDPTGMDAAELQKALDVLNAQADRIIALLGGKTGRGPGRRPAGTATRRSERFNTPELDRGIKRRPGRPRTETDDD